MKRRHMNCEEVMEHLFAYLDGELDDAAQADIDHHLEACRDCFTRAEFERRLKAKLADTGTVSAPERLRRRVRMLLDSF